MKHTEKLSNLVKVLRSKNSGPFELTIDILFDREENYIKVRDSGKITTETIAKLYNIPLDSISHVVSFDKAMGIKVTFLRPVSSGTCFDRDVYGAQQHAPLLELEI